MFKNMKLGLKIGLGFGCLLAIAIALGVMAIEKMYGVKTEATILSGEYIPEVQVSNDLERNTFLTMYNIRGYALAEDKTYYDEGAKSIEKMKDNLAVASKLADTAEQLVKLKGSVDEIDKGTKLYEQLIQQTVENNGRMADNRTQMDQSATTFMQNCYDFLKSQNDAMNEEMNANFSGVLERIQKINLANGVIESMNAIRLAVWRSQAEQNPDMAKQALNRFPDIAGKLNEIRKIVKLQEDIDRLTKIQQSTDNYKSTLEKLDGVAMSDEVKKQFNESATICMTNCEDFLTNQNQKLLEEIQSFKNSYGERKTKVTLSNEILDLVNTTRIAAWRAQAERQPKLIQDAQANFDVITKKYDEIKTITKLQVNLQQIETSQKSAADYKNAIGSLLTNWQTSQDLTEKRQNAGNSLLAKVQETAKAGMDQTTQIANRAVESLNAASQTLVIGLVIAVILGVIIAIYITRLIVKPLQMGVQFAEMVADGDLSQTMALDQRDEIGQLAQALNQMSQNLNEVMSGIMSAAEQVASSSEELSSSSQTLADGATEQASNLEETSAAIEQLTASVEQNTRNANETNELSIQAASQAEEGGQAVLETVAAMKKIAEQISIIQDISDQTNLLALNAAIEAARAGEMGKGFAVVAVEVRKLAERSQLAAKEINELASDSVSRAEKAGIMIQQIVPAIKKTAGKVQEIASACNEQSVGAEQIRGSVQQLDQVTQENSSASEEVAASSEELSAQAQNMQSMVSRFTLSNHKQDSYLSAPKKTSGSKIAGSKSNGSKSLPASRIKQIPNFSKADKTAKTGRASASSMKQGDMDRVIDDEFSQF
jgi:methyl-accepting chemotaxis protein